MTTQRQPIIPPGMEDVYNKIGYAPAVRVGNTLYISGQIGRNDKMELVTDKEAQFVQVFENIAKLSIVGVGMKTHSGVAAELFQSLAAQHINIDLISTSEIKISVTVDAAKVDDAQRAVHTAFGLDKKA